MSRLFVIALIIVGLIGFILIFSNIFLLSQHSDIEHKEASLLEASASLDQGSGFKTQTAVSSKTPILESTLSLTEVGFPEPEQHSSNTGIPKSNNADTWLELQVRTPNSYTTPLPEPEQSPIDGVYAKLDPTLPQWWQCRRCADYRPTGGIWKLQFDMGVMRIYYDVTGWYSVGSYSVMDDQLYIFNDPYCPDEVGEYRWQLEDKWGLENRSLILEVLEDECSINLRGKNLSNQPWLSCSPPNEMTAVSDHWHKPLGCELPNPDLLATSYPNNLDIEVSVHQGYTYDFHKQPDVYINASGLENDAQDGFIVTFSDESIPYGLNRVLYGEGDWVEVTTELPFEAVGVQLLGDNTIGWARVLFDGNEVWRGDTSEIWSKFGRHGGYIEVLDFEPGLHTIRVESLGFDFHPVTVAYFGFNKYGGVLKEEDITD